jgi:hypothetical protein
MKHLMINVVDRAYRFIHTLFDESTGGQVLLRLAECDPLPQWNKPTLERRSGANCRIESSEQYIVPQRKEIRVSGRIRGGPRGERRRRIALRKSHNY